MNTGGRLIVRLISAVVGLLLIVGTFLGVGQILTLVFGGGDFLVPATRWYLHLRTTPWSDESVLYVGVGLAVIGALLLALVAMSKVRTIDLRPPKASVAVIITPRAAAQMLRRQAESVPGVSQAAATVSADHARVSVTAPMANPDRVAAALQTTLEHALRQIPWQTLPELAVEIDSAMPGATPARGSASARHLNGSTAEGGR